MLDLGTIRPGSTVRIPFSSFDKDDGSSITMTNFAVGDILVYKDGGTTERASTAGYTATTDFDAKTGKHLAIIDLADNTTAGFFSAGSEYVVAIDAVTVDAVTTGGWVARFRIGYPRAIHDTTIATLSSQTSFTLTAGPAEDDALNGMHVIIHDVASAVQWANGVVQDYTGSTRTVTLAAAPTFTIAASDNFSVVGIAPLQATNEKLQSSGRTLAVESDGMAHADVKELGGTTQTARDIGASVLLSSGTGTGQVTLTSGRVNADLTHIATAAVNTASAQLGVNVVNFGGSAGTFASGRPEVKLGNVAHGGIASTLTLQNVVVHETNTGDAVSFRATDGQALALLSDAGHVLTITSSGDNGDGVNISPNGTGTGIRGNIVGNITGTISTVTTLTNLPAITANWLTATGIANDALTAAKIADGAIDAATFASGAINAAAIADNAIDAGAIAANAITAAKIADSAISALKLTDGTYEAIANKVGNAPVATQWGGSGWDAGSIAERLKDNLTVGTSDLATAANLTTLMNRVGAFTGSTTNTVLGFFQALMRGDSALTPGDVGGTYNNVTDSLEAQRDHSFIRSGVAQAGAAGSITLDSGASASDDFYNDQIVHIVGGNGVNQARLITDYVGATKVATVSPNWVTNPSVNSDFVILPASEQTTGSGATDWTADEKTAIKTILGVPASGTTPDVPSAGALKVIDDLLDTEVGAIKTKTDQLTFTVANRVDAQVLGIANDAITAAAFAADAGTEIANTVNTTLSGAHGAGAWGSGSAGTGAFTVTVTVNDGTNPLQNASVRLTEGINNYTAQTNASGVATFALDAATYGIAITKSGYEFTPTTIVVAGAGNHTKSMTATVVSAPSAPSLAVVFDDLDLLDGSPAANIEIHFQLVGDLIVEAGGLIAYRDVTATTDAAGHFEQELLRTDLADPTTLHYRVDCEPLKISNRIIKPTAASVRLRDILE